MKKIVMAMMMIGLVAASYAGVSVNWGASSGFYFNADPFTGILGLDDSGNSTIAQLMYSPDAIQDAGSLDGIGLDGLSAGTGNDVIWATFAPTADNSQQYVGYGTFSAPKYEQALVSGYVYAMIFQDNVIGGGDWYFYTSMASIEDIIGAATPQAIQLNNDLTNGDPIDSGVTTAQVVPEPATLLLFGIGGMGAWLLRRRQQA